MCKKDKQLLAAILSVATRVRLGGGGDNRVVFTIRMHKNEVSEALRVLCSNLGRKFSKKQILLFQF
jgi:hypothetical protein